MLPEGGGPSVSADRTGVAIGLPGHGQGPRGPGLPHGHPGGGDAAPGPGRGGLQACDERISVPVESLQQFLEVYKALVDRIGGPGLAGRSTGVKRSSGGSAQSPTQWPPPSTASSATPTT